MDKIEVLQQMIDESEKIVFFGGAGVSTESGIPDFRSVDGLYHQKYDYPPETILSHTFFMRKPEEFYRFYRDKMLCLSAKPNAAHKKLAELEKAGKLERAIKRPPMMRKRFSVKHGGQVRIPAVKSCGPHSYRMARNVGQTPRRTKRSGSVRGKEKEATRFRRTAPLSINRRR